MASYLFLSALNSPNLWLAYFSSLAKKYTTISMFFRHLSGGLTCGLGMEVQGSPQKEKLPSGHLCLVPVHWLHLPAPGALTARPGGLSSVV